MKILNNAGEEVEFQVEKLENSLRNSGASEESIKKVISKVFPNCYDGITTGKIYKMAFDELSLISNSVAARYSLKRALLELGPAGYFFEQWIARVFQNIGYKTETGKLIQGNAVMHEADVIAQKGEKTYWVECKFRNSDQTKISVTTPMYVLSRIRDISDKEYALFGTKTKFTDGWLITNAYFTTDSIAFGEYYGLKLLSWDYPQRFSIKNIVDENLLYPVTCLTTISSEEKQKLLESKCILVKELLTNFNLLDKINLPKNQQQKVIREAKELMKIKIEE